MNVSKIGLPTSTPSGTYPELTPFANTNRSGLTPSWSTPNQAPVRPKPTITSSAMYTMSWRVQIADPAQIAGWRHDHPELPITDSRTRAEIVEALREGSPARDVPAPARTLPRGSRPEHRAVQEWAEEVDSTRCRCHWPTVGGRQ